MYNNTMEKSCRFQLLMFETLQDMRGMLLFLSATQFRKKYSDIRYQITYKVNGIFYIMFIFKFYEKYERLLISQQGKSIIGLHKISI